MDGSGPTATTLHNYDNDRDASEGIVIARGGFGVDESDPTQFQAWRSEVFPWGAVMPDAVTVTLWTAMRDFEPGKKGSLLIHLRDFDGATYTPISSTLFNKVDWQEGSSTWQELSFSFPTAGIELAAGHQLELKIVVNEQSEDDLWFAYDTTAYPARIDVP